MRELRAILRELLHGGLFVLAFAVIVIVAVGKCHESPAAPRPPKIHVGACTIHYKYYLDRADRSQGSFTITTRDSAENCPDSVWLVWDDDLPPGATP